MDYGKMRGALTALSIIIPIELWKMMERFGESGNLGQQRDVSWLIHSVELWKTMGT